MPARAAAPPVPRSVLRPGSPSVPRPVPVPDPPARADRGRVVHRLGSGRDGGQTTVLVAFVVGVALLVLLGLTRLGTAVVERAQARTAADAAALAGVVEEARGGGAGRRSAAEVAAANGATLTAYVVDGATVEVTVRFDDAQATSRAERVVAGGG
jgi:secretion/DNA translocation related TadE-like protein